MTEEADANLRQIDFYRSGLAGFFGGKNGYGFIGTVLDVISLVVLKVPDFFESPFRFRQ